MAGRRDKENERNRAATKLHAHEHKNIFKALMGAVKTNSLGQISYALYDVGGGCRRNM